MSAADLNGSELTLTLEAPAADKGVGGKITIPVGKVVNDNGVVNSAPIVINFAADTVN